MATLPGSPNDPTETLLIIGGGAGGLELAIHLGRRPPTPRTRVVLVDKNTAHVWKPRLHELAVGLIGAGEGEGGYLSLAQANGFEFEWGEVTAIDLVRRSVTIARNVDAQGAEVLGQRERRYDTLVLAVGSRVNDFGIEGVLAHCQMLDSPAQALDLHRQLFEAAMQIDAGHRQSLSVGIVGAGATGVELAAELHHAAHAMHVFGGLGGPEKLRISLIDQAPRVLPAVDEKTSRAALATLRSLGVNVRLSQQVQRVTADAIHLKSGEAIPCDIKVWASGVIGEPIVGEVAGLAVGKGRRAVVDDYLACEGHPGVYALGDCAGATAGAGGPLPPTAQAAHQQATWLAASLRQAARGRRGEPFRFRERGTLVSLGEGDAAGELPAPGTPRRLAPPPWLAKLLYGALFQMHRMTLYGAWRTLALMAADKLRGIALPPVKLH